jgi:hypothetical protein
MQPTSLCNRIQESIVAGDALGEAEQSHIVTCASCAEVAADCLALDSAIADGLDGAEVPTGFADRVMAGIAAEPSASSRIQRMLDRPWLKVALANVGLAVAITSVLRFVLSTLLPTVSLGGLP